ncbi:MAG: DUF2793 domain-containing protein [Pseudomonadota bacterium]
MMAETANLGLPLVAAAQTQKHVTVNESLVLVDALVQGHLNDLGVGSPPANPMEGDLFDVATGATDDWAGKDGSLALMTSGGWRFVAPKEGWRLRNATDGLNYVFIGGTWTVEAPAVSKDGATFSMKVLTFDEVLTSGATVTTVGHIPADAHVIAVSSRIIGEITTDTGTSWKYGVAGGDDRYGNGLGFAVDTSAKGISGSGVTYYSSTPLLLTCDGGAFTGGSIRFAVHYWAVTPPA